MSGDQRKKGESSSAGRSVKGDDVNSNNSAPSVDGVFDTMDLSEPSGRNTAPVRKGRASKAAIPLPKKTSNLSSNDVTDRRKAAARKKAKARATLPETGQAFGRYTLLKRIAWGGMGEIFLAKQAGVGGFEKLVAIKRILAHYQSDESLVNMFFDEARLQALLSDHHVVQIYDMGEEDDHLYIAMEFVHGASIRQVFERAEEMQQTVHPAHIIDMMVQVCRGLGYAHNVSGNDGESLRIVHRDVNPHNILVSYDGEVKIIDFGIAKSELSQGNTETGTIKGKFAYMSPEQSAAEPLDQRSDIFSLGICLYEMLMGKNPFHRQNVVLSLEAIQKFEPTPMCEVKPELALFDPILEAALAKEVADRYQSCDAMADALVDLGASGTFGDPPQSLRALLYDLFASERAEHANLMNTTGSAMALRSTSDSSYRSEAQSAARAVRGTSSESLPIPTAPRSASHAAAPGASRAASLGDHGTTPGAIDDAAAPNVSQPTVPAAPRALQSADANDTGPTGFDLQAQPRRRGFGRALLWGAGLGVLLGVGSLVLVTSLPESAPAHVVLPGVPPNQEPAVVVAPTPAPDHAVTNPPSAIPPTKPDSLDVTSPPPKQPVTKQPTQTSKRHKARGGKKKPVRPTKPAVVQRIVLGKLTLRASSGYQLKGKGSRGTNQATVKVLQGQKGNMTVKGPLLTKLRFQPDGKYLSLSLRTTPWAIVRINNIGKGKTPSTIRLNVGRPTKITLKNPKAGELSLTLKYTPSSK